MWRRVPNLLRETLIRSRSNPTVTSSPIPINPTSSQSAMKPSCLFSHQFSSGTIVAKKAMPIATGHEREPAAQQTQIGFRTGSPGQVLFKMGMVKPALLTRCIATANTEAPVSQNTIPDVPPPRIKFKRLDKQARHIMQILDKEAVQEVKDNREVAREIANIKPGYSIQLKVEVPENKRRISTIKGIVIARRNAGLHSTFRIRRQVAGVGVESVFPLYSPNIKELKIIGKDKVRKAKLYYLRDRLNALKKQASRS